MPAHERATRMRHAIRVGLALLVAAPGPAHAESEGPRPALALDALFATVERTHPLMDAARAGLDSLRARMNQADWAYFPSVRMSAGTTIVPTITGDALVSRTDWGRLGVFGDLRVEVVQPLFTFGRIDALQAAAEKGIGVGRAAVEVARWELRSRAAEAWYSTQLARELDGLLADGKEWIDKAEARMEKMRDEDSPEYDQLEHLRLKTRVAEFYELQARNEMLKETAAAGMRVLLGLRAGESPPPLPKGELEPVDFTPLAIADYVAIARAHDPGLQLARARAGAQDALADARAAELWPNLVILGDVRATRAPTIDEPRSIFANDPFNRTLGAIALGLEWRLDVPQRLFAKDEARATARRAHAEAAVQEQLMEVNVTRLAQDLLNQRSLLDVYRASRKASQGWLTATWDTYESGFGTFRDVMDALVQFYEKRIGHLQVVYNHNLALWRLSQAIGADVRALRPAAPSE
jgi:multidrug efflux system outer membrane protein